MSTAHWLSILLAFVLSLALTPLATAYARKNNLLDHPGQRRSHSRIIPRGGGLAAVCVLLILLVFDLIYSPNSGTEFTRMIRPAFLQAVFLLAVVGYLDDHQMVNSRVKLLVQSLASAIMLSLFWQGENLPLGGAFWLLVVIFLAVVWLTNLYNFMDGSHGLAAAQGIFSGILLAGIFWHYEATVLTWLASLIAAVSGGFIFWNFPRPKVFMGDVLSGVLGISFAVMIVAAWLKFNISPFLLSMVLASFAVDATLTLIARIMKGQKWYNPHREHVYQQLVAGHLGHTGTWLVYQVLNFVLILPAVWLVESGRTPVELTAVCVYLLFSLLWYAVYRKDSKENNK